MSIRTFSVVTTCHKEGYNLYGRRIVETFDRHWPREIVLYLYAENFKPDIMSNRIVCLDLLAECPELVAFKRRHEDNPWLTVLQAESIGSYKWTGASLN